MRQIITQIRRHICYFLLLYFTSHTAFSADFFVRFTSMYGAGSLDRAIKDANAAGAGPHRILIDRTNDGILVLEGNLPTINTNVTIMQLGAGRLTVNGVGTFRAIDAGGGREVIVKDITIINGASTFGGGAAIVRPNGNLTLENCIIQNSSALAGSNGGGAIWNNGILAVRDCLIEGNIAVAGGGGAIRNDVNRNLTIENSIFRNNNTEAVGGGALLINGGNSVVNITNSTFTDNSTSVAGGLHGGAVFMLGGELDLNKSTISGNRILAGGGGGGIRIQGGNASIVNCTFYGNIAPGVGGAVSQAAGGNTTILNSTIVDNIANSGGGGVWFNAGTVSISNNIVVKNSNGDLVGTFNSAHGNNLVGFAPNLIWASGANAEGSKTGITAIDVFGTANPVLSDNGGMTRTLALSEGENPAVNPAFMSGAPTTDQRGFFASSFPRDIGSFEREGTLEAPISLVGIETEPVTYFLGEPAISLTSSLQIESGEAITSASVFISDGLSALNDVLAAPTLPLGITTNYSGGRLTITGNASTEVYENILKSVIFQTSVLGSGSRTVEFEVSSSVRSSAPLPRQVIIAPAVTKDGGTTNYASTILVENTNDEGPGSFRQALITANGRSGATPSLPHFISFEANLFSSQQTIGLYNELPNINNHVVIQGSESKVIITRSSEAISEGKAVRLLDIAIDRNVSIRNLIFKNGLKGQGAGINNNGDLIVENCTFEENMVTATGGAGIFNNGKLTVTNSTFSRNVIVQNIHGAGIFNAAGKTLIVSGSTFNDNFSTATTGPSNGGGIYNDGQAIVTNSTFIGNRVRNGGGFFANSGLLKAYNVTVIRNNAGFGGGGARQTNAGSLNINNSIFAGNTASTGPDISDASGSGVSSDHGNNVFSSTAGFNASGNTTGNITSTLNGLFGTTEPQLADNGGLTQTVALQSGSAAIDPVDPMGTPELDQRGFGSNGARDRGSFEFGGVIFLVSNIEPTRLSYGIGDPATFITRNLKVSSLEDLTGASVTISNGYKTGTDLLLVDEAQLPGGISLIAFDQSAGKLELQGSASASAYQQALRAIAFSSIDDTPGTRSISFAVNSGEISSNEIVRIVEVVNPAISIAVIEEEALNYIANNQAKNISESITLISNVATLTGATISVTSGYIQGEDVLQLPAQSVTDITSSFDANSGTLILTGTASFADYQNALRAIRYINNNPLDPGTFSKTISFNISRRALNSNSVSKDITIVQPTISLEGIPEGLFSYYSPGSAAGILSPDVQITSSGSNANEAIITIAEGYKNGDLLAMPVLPGNLRWQWDKEEGKLRIFGESSLINYQTAIRGIVFQHRGSEHIGVRKFNIFITNGVFSENLNFELEFEAPEESLFTENFQYPADAVLNILSYGAELNKGIVNATAAIQKAINDNGGDLTRRLVIYFPDGVYKISNSLVLAHTSSNSGSGSGNGLNIVGQSREGTVFKLEDEASGFQDKENPKPVLSYGGTGASNITGFTNIAFMCNLFNITINTGSGNPGASGLIFIANNQGSVRNVTIKSGDGSGWTGLDMETARIAGPGLIKNVDIEGFDYGIRVAGTNYGMTAENVNISNVNHNALYVNQHIFNIRKLTTSNIGGTAVRNIHPDGFLTIIDSDLSGSGEFAIENEGFLLARNVNVSGYTHSLNDHGDIFSDDIEEYLYNPENDSKPFAKFANRTEKSLNLGEGNLLETPEVDWDDVTGWVSVTDFGYQPGTAALPNFDDALPAIRAAIAFMNAPGNENKTTLYFPPGEYRLGADVPEPVNILVEGNVKRIIGNFAGLWTKVGIEAQTAPLFKIGQSNHSTIIIESMNIPPQFGPNRLKKMGVFENSSSSDVVLRNVYIGHGKAYKNAGASGRLYIEDMSALSHHYYVRGSEEFVYPEAVPQFEFGNQEVWARQFNPEQFGRDYQASVQIDGGQLWILGLKTEDRGIFHARNAKMEILGGTILPSFDVDPESPKFLVEDSEVSISVAEQSRAITSTTVAGYFTTIVEERRGGEVRLLMRDEIPGRIETSNPGAPTGYFGFVLPMYVAAKMLDQTIQFPEIEDKVFGVEPFELNAVASSGLSVQYTVISGLAEINGNMITLLGVGPVQVKASQDGDGSFNPAEEITRSFDVLSPGKAKSIKPEVNCVRANSDGTFTALFGYQNDNSFAVYIPAGESNFLSEGNISTIQEYFQPGKFETAFEVTFSGSSVIWTILGPDGTVRSDEAKSNSKKCKIDFSGIQSNLKVEEDDQYISLNKNAIYPNPFKDRINLIIQAERAEAAIITVSTIDGIIIMQTQTFLEAGKNNMELFAEKLRSGIYMIIVESPSINYRARIIKE